MIIILYLEQCGVIIDKKRCDYAVRRKIANAWYRMYPGKNVTVFYKLESSFNYEPITEREQASNG